MHILKSYLKELLISIFGIIIIFLLRNLSQNGRYQTTEHYYTVLDTRTGRLYLIDKNQYKPDGSFYWKLYVHDIGNTLPAKK